MTNPLSEVEITESLEQLSGWKWQDDSLKKTFFFTNFREAMSFILRVSYEAEERNHHPEIFNCYNRVEIGLNTHDAGGKVTQKDIDLARKIEKLSTTALSRAF
jgi:4a-hydroxytetrahydrobiopterin dehydratase